LSVRFCGQVRPANTSIVSVNKAATPDRETWGTAFITVQSAFNTAKDGDEGRD
jgi:hypothetical protein